MNRVESSNETRKTSYMDMEEKEYIEEGKLGSRMSHGKQRNKGAIHETWSEGAIHTRGKFGDKKQKIQVGSHIKGGPVDDIGMA